MPLVFGVVDFNSWIHKYILYIPPRYRKEKRTHCITILYARMISRKREGTRRVCLDSGYLPEGGIYNSSCHPGRRAATSIQLRHQSEEHDDRPSKSRPWLFHIPVLAALFLLHCILQQCISNRVVDTHRSSFVVLTQERTSTRLEEERLPRHEGGMAETQEASPQDGPVSHTPPLLRELHEGQVRRC